MKKLKIIVTVLIMALIVSCGDSSNGTDDFDNYNEELVLDEELKAGIQFDPSTIKVPSNFIETVPGGQFIAIQTLINLQTPVLLIDENATVESISILDDTLYFTQVRQNDCGLPTDEYTQRYQWSYLDFSYTAEVGQNSEYNFWITEFKGVDDNEEVRVMISGREKRGDEVSGCMFINSNDDEANIKLEWYVSDGGITEGETVFTYIVYDGNDKQVVTMNIKPDGSGKSKVTQIIVEADTSETVVETLSFFWTVDGIVTN